MEAIILAGGFGTRLRSLVSDMPKPMAPVLGRPFLSYLLDMLFLRGFKSVVLSVGYKAESIISFFGDDWHGMSLSYSIESFPLGTGGGIKLALSKCSNSHVFVLNGDTYCDFEFPLVEAMWKSDQSPILVGCHIESAERYGRLEVSGEKLLGFMPRGGVGPGVINAGAYVLPRNELDYFRAGESFSFESVVVPHLISLDRIRVFVSKSPFLDIGVPLDYLRAGSFLEEVSRCRGRFF